MKIMFPSLPCNQRRPGDYFLLVECCLVASRVLWTKTGVNPLPFLVYFSFYLLPGAQLCWPELSPPLWSWGQGPYLEDVGQWCRRLLVLWGLCWPELSYMVLPASDSTYKRNAFLLCLNHYFGSLSLTAECNPNWWHTCSYRRGYINNLSVLDLIICQAWILCGWSEWWHQSKSKLKDQKLFSIIFLLCSFLIKNHLDGDCYVFWAPLMCLSHLILYEEVQLLSPFYR